MYTVLSIVSIKKVAELCSRKKLFLTKMTNFSSGDKNLVLKMNYTSKQKVSYTKSYALRYLQYKIHYIFVICLFIYSFISSDLFRSN